MADIRLRAGGWLFAVVLTRYEDEEPEDSESYVGSSTATHLETAPQWPADIPGDIGFRRADR